MSDDPAFEAAIDAVDRRWWTGDGAENRRIGEITRVALDAARPVWEADLLAREAVAEAEAYRRGCDDTAAVRTEPFVQ